MDDCPEFACAPLSEEEEPPPILDPVDRIRALLKQKELPSLASLLAQLQQRGTGYLICVDLQLTHDARTGRATPQPSSASAYLWEHAPRLMQRIYDAGADGSLLVARMPLSLDGDSLPLCSSIELFAPSAARFQRLGPHPKTGNRPECGTCGYTLSHAYAYSCALSRTVSCARCLRAGVLSQLTADEREALLRADEPVERPLSVDWVGDPPAVDGDGRVNAWFLWTGDNKIPAYLELCIASFARRAAQGFHVRVVRSDDVQEKHPAYEYLSLVHRADYLRCELLHRYGGLYCDVDTLCWSDLSRPLARLADEGCAAVLASEELVHECGVNVGLFRRRSWLTTHWRAALHARLDARLNSLIEFRNENPELTEDGLEWNEVLRDLLIPLLAASRVLHPGAASHCLRAHHWHDPSHPQGFDPLALKHSEDEPPASEEMRGMGRVGNDVEVVVLNNNQYSERVKRATSEEFLASGSGLTKIVRLAVSPPYAPGWNVVNPKVI